MQDKLHVNVKLSLTGLYSRNDLYREKCDGKYVYFNNRLPYRKQQLLNDETAGDPITGLKWTKTKTGLRVKAILDETSMANKFDT